MYTFQTKIIFHAFLSIIPLYRKPFCPGKLFLAMRNLHRRDSMSSFIHFSLPLSIPLEARTLHTTTIQMHKSRSSIIRQRSRFNFNRWCVFLSYVMDTSRMQTSSYTERPGSISYCTTFYNSSWGVHRGPKQNNVRTLRTKDDGVLRANHKIVRPQKLNEQLARIWRNQHLLFTQNQLVLSTMTRRDFTQSINWGWTPREC